MDSRMEGQSRTDGRFCPVVDSAFAASGAQAQIQLPGIVVTTQAKAKEMATRPDIAIKLTGFGMAFQEAIKAQGKKPG